jgi:uncharacterized protein
MRKLSLIVALIATMPAFAQDQPASEASVRELMALTNSKALLDQMYAQVDGLMESSMKEAMGGRTGNEEQQRLAAELRSKIVALLREDMSWEDLEPVYLQLYTSTLSQAEVDGMNAFYRSPAGQAVIAKMPLMMQSLMKVLMERMQVMMPKARALGEEYGRKLRAAGEK